jgi:hypothetical protein
MGNEAQYPSWLRKLIFGRCYIPIISASPPFISEVHATTLNGSSQKFADFWEVQVGCYDSIQIILLSIKECSISSPSQPSSTSSEDRVFQSKRTPNNAACKS